ncbi:hypothetical protein RYX36_035214, partial [Vicia faba]
KPDQIEKAQSWKLITCNITTNVALIANHSRLNSSNLIADFILLNIFGVHIKPFHSSSH